MAKQHFDPSVLGGKLDEIGKKDVVHTVPNADEFEEPIKTIGSNTNTPNPNSTTNTPATTTVDEPTKLKIPGATINIPKDKTTVTNPNPTTNTVEPTPILNPPAFGGGSQDPDIVDLPTGPLPGGNGGGGGTKIPSSTIEQPQGPQGGGGGLGGNGPGEIKFEIPTSVLTGNNEAIADWAVDILDQTLIAWFKDRPTLNKASLVALMIQEKITKPVQDIILRRIDTWNKAVHDHLSLTRDERDSLVAALMEILKAHSKIAESLTPEVRAGILALLVFVKKYRDSSAAMPDASLLLREIRDEIRKAQKDNTAETKAA